ncbi:unnamed protein product [Cylindrotheca closterium]|uniref:2-(3-amino-3-carboxypropyl)histidine synthase subunit 2 n=1 Tax=Cylindrotheca closterium TaxID=2856 RepID=A0AAD2FJV0_9STRA|nr:unnamed protein product [Cylindrotheca closterium]
MSERRAPPPQLHFDDGSRIMTEAEESSAAVEALIGSIRGPQTSLESFYDIERVCQDVVDLMLPNIQSTDNTSDNEEEDTAKQSPEEESPLWRIAVQFPDSLLNDSPEVCWLLEEKITNMQQDRLQSMQASGMYDAVPNFKIPLVFCLGDTTMGSSVPDEVAALHLNADVLIHFGHASLFPTERLPVIYSFGKVEMDVTKAVESVIQQQQQQEEDGDNGKRKLLLLYQVGYHHAMKDFETKLCEQSKNTEIVVGQLPKPRLQSGKLRSRTAAAESTCCKSNGQEASCQSPATCGDDSNKVSCDQQSNNNNDDKPQTPISETAAQVAPLATDEGPKFRQSLLLGGLELPDHIKSWDDLSDYTILFIGDSESTSERQYTNIMLRFLSLPAPPQAYWTYSPKSMSLSIDLPMSLNRQLKRRFFLSQKARDAHVFGILVANLSQQHLVDVVKSLKRIIHDAGKASYSFAVGKINPAKLANFAEIECFVLVACPEHSLLQDEREYHVPIITPLELEIALGHFSWGEKAYSLDCQDVLEYLPPKEESSSKATKADGDGQDGDETDEDEDAPYFSLVTGTYVQKASKDNAALDLEALPGKGQVTAYNSEAANFLKQREYQGLETLAGQTEVKPATEGQRGIASNYEGS